MMTAAEMALASITGETAARAALDRIAAGTSAPTELANAFAALQQGAQGGDCEILAATASGFHRAIQKRLEAI